MPVRIEPNAEPIAGYKLIERLGGGGFGEVWKAEAPGGLHKAIKFVFGDLQAADDADGARATQELKALSRVKTVHHPYILSLERFDIIDGQLIIVMELADRTLWDRFRECRNQGLPGIPRDELLQYMRETAEALDLMNVQFQLQHLDIKPQNLFLVFNHIKVADFGLVKDLGNMAAATVTGGVTPVYAAPETFDGWLSRYSDQYSLAIVYQELLTGQRPFTGATMRQLVLQHLQGEPDLASLPGGDRPAVKRALAKNPDERFPTCVEFIQALTSCGPAAPSAVPRPSRESVIVPPATDTPFTAEPPANEDDAEATVFARGKQPRRDATPKLAVDFQGRPEVLPPRPPKGSVVDAEPASESRGSWPRSPKSITSDPLGSRSEITCGGIVQPSLVVGLGKLGVQTLLAMRRAMTQQYGHADSLPHVRLLGIDTDAVCIQEAGQGDPQAVLRAHELVQAKLHRPRHYLQMRDRDGVLRTDSWLNARVLYRIPKQTNRPGLRPLGRLAYVDNCRLIHKRMESELLACASQDTLHELLQHTDLGIRSTVPRVYIVAGLGGTTGGSMFLDAAYTLRHLLRKHGYNRAEVVGLFFLPGMEGEGIRSTALANSYAALMELNHFAHEHATFSARYHMTEGTNEFQAINEDGAPFERCFFLTLPTMRLLSDADTVPSAVGLAGQFLYRDVATPLGKAADETRRQVLEAKEGSAHEGPTCSTLSLYRISWPRRTLLERAGRKLCCRLVDHWMSKDAKAVSEVIGTWAQQQWEACGLRPEDLIARHQDGCAQRLKQTPETIFQNLLNPLATLLAQVAGKADVPLAPVAATMGKLEEQLSVPEACRPTSLASPTPGLIEKALGEVATALAEASDRQLTEMIVRLLEEPAYRLAGAEEGLRQFSKIAERALQSQETLTQELHERAAKLYQRIQAVLETPPAQPLTQTTSGWKLGFGRKSQAPSTFGTDLFELIRLYAKTRYQCFVLDHINRLYVSLRGHLSDQVREVGFCRTRLTELAGLLEVKPAPPPAAPYEKMLLPQGCTTLDEAVERLDTALTQDDLLNLDAAVQEIINKQFRALIQVCMGPSNLVRALAPMMVQQAEVFLTPRFQGEGVADMWVTDKDGDEGQVAADLTVAFDQAAPVLSKPLPGSELQMGVFPAGPSGQELKRLAARTLGGKVQLVDEECDDEVTFYREFPHLTLRDLDQFGPVAMEAYRQKNAADPNVLHSRIDVAGWTPAAT